MKKIRIISDSHGLKHPYVNIARKSDYSIGIGDVDFDYKFLNQLDPNNHKIFGGNHDNYDDLPNVPHNLGHYGSATLNGITFFFIRGGFSIDWAWRARHEQLTGQKIWWKEEELSLSQMNDCLELYKATKPDFVLSHECTAQITKSIGHPGMLEEFGFDKDWSSNTQRLLEACFEAYQPKLWISGHMHKNCDITIGRTRFICLNMIPRYKYFIDVNENLEIV